MADQLERNLSGIAPARYGAGSETGWTGGWTITTAQSAPNKRQDAIVPMANEGDGISFAVIVPAELTLTYTISFYRRVGDAWVLCTVWEDVEASKIVSRRRAGDQVAFKITAITVATGDIAETPLVAYFKTTGSPIDDA